MWRLRATSAATVLVAALLAGCQVGQTAAEPDPLTATCTSTEAGYTLQYPADWHTEPDNDYPVCHYFHPESFSVPDGGEATHFGAIVAVVPESFEVVRGWSSDERFERVLSEVETVVNGRPAVVIESESTGEGLLDRGTLTYRYVVDLGDGRAVDASTRTTEGLDYDANKAVLDAMMASLEFTGR